MDREGGRLSGYFCVLGKQTLKGRHFTWGVDSTRWTESGHGKTSTVGRGDPSVVVKHRERIGSFTCFGINKEKQTGEQD